MSDLRIQYLAVKAKAARLRQRFQENNPGEDIERSETFLAEDWRIAAKEVERLAIAVFTEHYREHGYPYSTCACTLQREKWKQNPRLRRNENAR